MHSLLKHYPVKTSSGGRQVIATAIRINNDINGNPRAKVQVWTCSEFASIWSPKVKGFRRSKDDTYILKSCYDLEQSLNDFMRTFEESINEVTV